MIEKIVKQQSKFMVESGCVPPGEMGCYNDQSYDNLLKHLTSLGSASSELGKVELYQCLKQISDYRITNQEYKQCLIDNNNPNFSLPTNRLVQPLLKGISCPIFYGPNASYNTDIDMCLCNSGYFMSNEKCVDASSICKEKYGPSAYAKNGNCIVTRATVIPTTKPSTIPSYSPRVLPTVTPTPVTQKLPPISLYTPKITPTPSDTTGIAPSPETPPLTQIAGETNPIIIFWEMIATGFKKLINLF